jgi:hypothetical protein
VVLAPGIAHLHGDGRHSGDHQRPGDNEHAYGEQRVDVCRDAGDEDHQPEGTARYPQRGDAPRRGVDTGRAELPRQLDQALLLVELALQFPQPLLFFVRQRHDVLRPCVGPQRTLYAHDHVPL